MYRTTNEFQNQRIGEENVYKTVAILCDTWMMWQLAEIMMDNWRGWLHYWMRPDGRHLLRLRWHCDSESMARS